MAPLGELELLGVISPHEQVVNVPFAMNECPGQLGLQRRRGGLDGGGWMGGGQDQKPLADLIAALVEALPQCIFGAGRRIDACPAAHRVDVSQQLPDTRNHLCVLPLSVL